MRIIELTGSMKSSWNRPVYQSTCDAGQRYRIQGEKSASTNSDLDNSRCSSGGFFRGWILKVCGTLGDPVGGSPLLLGLSRRIEVCDRGNRDSGWPWIARAVPQAMGGDHVGGRDGGRIRHAPCTRRVCPAPAPADFRRAFVWTLLVAASSPLEKRNVDLIHSCQD